MAEKKVCYFDLDGVFAPYPRCWLDFIALKTGTCYESLTVAKETLTYFDYVRLKEEYRSSDYKYELDAREGSSELSRWLHESGFTIVVATTRPSGHRRLMLRTIRWLDRNDIIFDDIVFHNGFEVCFRYPSLVFGVEDDLQKANMLARWGYTMFFMRNGREARGCHENVIPINGFKDMMGVLWIEEDENRAAINIPRELYETKRYGEVVTI